MVNVLVRAGVAAALLLLAGACDSLSASAAAPAAGARATRGTVTGLAAVCAGLTPPGQVPRLRVIARSGPRTVARQWVSAGVRDAGGRYRLRLPPGDYVITAPRSSAPPAAVVVRAGRTITVNFPQHCRP